MLPRRPGSFGGCGAVRALRGLCRSGQEPKDPLAVRRILTSGTGWSIYSSPRQRAPGSGGRSLPMRLSMVGTGYVGLVTGVCLSNTGNHVTCLDVDARKVERLRAGELTPSDDPTS